jgi:probable phosphoglycerate mutase
LVRHGETSWNVEGRFQGLADIDLTPSGEAQAERAGIALARFVASGLTVDVVASSDLSRARKTAEKLAAAIGAAAVHTDVRLRERDVGQWSGLTVQAIEDKFPGMLARFRSGEVDRLPDGESTAEVRDRALAAVLDFGSASADGGVVVAVTHGGVIRTLEDHLGITPRGTKNLGGRWFEYRDGVLTAGDKVVLGE